MTGACALAGWLAIEVGRALVERQHLAGAADAAAYAGALAEARALNYASHAQRAIVANEVLIAQAVSVDAWVHYGATLGENAATVASLVPPLRAVLPLVTRTLRVARGVTESLAHATVRATSALDHALAAAADAAVLAAPLAAQALADATLAASAGPAPQRHRPTAAAPVAAAIATRNAARFAALTRRHGGDARSRLRDLVLASRDPFSIRRPGNRLTNLDLGLAGVEKTSGETRLVGFERWEAQDTLDGWIRTPFGKRELAPLAWGRATAALRPTPGDYWCGPRRPQVGRCRWSWTWAWASTHANPGFLGLPALRDVRDPRERDPSADFLVVVTAPVPAVAGAPGDPVVARTASAPPASTETAAPTTPLIAAARARVAFARPQDPRDRTATTLLRADGAVEYGSLFNPYWQARLAPLPLAERLAWLAPLGVPRAWLLASGPR